MKKSKIKNSDGGQTGQAVLITILFFLLTSSALLLAFSSIALRETNSSRRDLRSKQSYFLAEAGLEDVLWRMRTGQQYTPSQSVSLNGLSATVSITVTGGQGVVESTGEVAGAIRRARAVLRSGAGVSFVYGVQVGDLGLEMGNSSSVIGNVYSNGDIAGGGKMVTTITGTAIAAGNHLIKDIRINGDAYADRFDNCIVNGTAHYVTSFTANCTAGSTVADASPQPPGAFPITQQQIDTWKAEAAAGGTLSGYSAGNDAAVTLGPKKINGNLSFGNNVVLTLTGTVWVTGTVGLGNSNTIRLNPGTYGEFSGMLITDSAVDLGNTVSLQGTGQPGSYLMLLSTFGPSDAIDVGNSAAGAILYAPNGIIDIGNSLSLHEATGRGLRTGNDTSITYESGLANVNFISGPTGGWSITTWNEVK